MCNVPCMVQGWCVCVRIVLSGCGWSVSTVITMVISVMCYYCVLCV
jgi:hypothetical protein